MIRKKVNVVERETIIWWDFYVFVFQSTEQEVIGNLYNLMDGFT